MGVGSGKIRDRGGTESRIVTKGLCNKLFNRLVWVRIPIRRDKNVRTKLKWNNLLHDLGVVYILPVGQVIAELAARVDGVRVIQLGL